MGLSSYLEATPDLKSDAYIVCISPAVSSYADDSDTGRGGVGGGGGVAADSVSPLSLDSLEHKHYSPNIRRYVVTVVRGTVPPLYPDSIVRPPTETLFLLITVGLRRIYNPDNIFRVSASMSISNRFVWNLCLYHVSTSRETHGT